MSAGHRPAISSTKVQIMFVARGPQVTSLTRHPVTLRQDPGLCHQRLDTKSAILGRFRTRDFWQILYAKISDIPFWRLFVRKLYLTYMKVHFCPFPSATVSYLLVYCPGSSSDQPPAKNYTSPSDCQAKAHSDAINILAFVGCKRDSRARGALLNSMDGLDQIMVR